jgi:hypothetical protein
MQNEVKILSPHRTKKFAYAEECVMGLLLLAGLFEIAGAFREGGKLVRSDSTTAAAIQLHKGQALAHN